MKFQSPTSNLYDLRLVESTGELETVTALFWWHLRRNHHCLVRIFCRPSKVVIVLSELGTNQGQSLTNCIEDIAPQICDRFGLNLQQTTWIEHLGPFSGLQETEEFSIVELGPDTDPSPQSHPGLAPLTRRYPQWNRISREAVEELTQAKLEPVSFAIAEVIVNSGMNLEELGFSFGDIEQADCLTEPRDIYCKQIGAFRLTNVPHSPVQHSPSGFSWGYPGSGPAELALCILNLFISEDGQAPIDCYRGTCSLTAWMLHQDFKNAFITSMPESGGVIRAAEVSAWIKQHGRPRGSNPSA